MQKPDIFGILKCLEPFHNCTPTLIQNPTIFTKIGKPTLCNPRNSEPWHIDNPGIPQNPGIFKFRQIFRTLSKDLRWCVLRKYLKVHHCRFGNLPICLDTFKNHTLKISHSHSSSSTLLLCKDKNVTRFSDLHWCNAL